jgi:hypothetical protein
MLLRVWQLHSFSFLLLKLCGLIFISNLCSLIIGQGIVARFQLVLVAIPISWSLEATVLSVLHHCLFSLKHSVY